MKRIVLGLLGIGVMLGFSQNLCAQLPKGQVIAHLTELYGANEATRLYEEMQVRDTLERFASKVDPIVKTNLMRI